MSYIVYSATSLESFLERKIEENNEIYYLKSKLQPKFNNDIIYTDKFHYSARRATQRLLDDKTPLIMTLEAESTRGKLPGNLKHHILELWLKENHAPEPHNNEARNGFICYEPKNLMILLQSYEKICNIFIPKQQHL